MNRGDRSGSSDGVVGPLDAARAHIGSCPGRRTAWTGPPGPPESVMPMPIPIPIPMPLPPTGRATSAGRDDGPAMDMGRTRPEAVMRLVPPPPPLRKSPSYGPPGIPGRWTPWGEIIDGEAPFRSKPVPGSAIAGIDENICAIGIDEPSCPYDMWCGGGPCESGLVPL